MKSATEISPRFANKRPQRRYLKIGIGVFIALLALTSLAFVSLLYRAPMVVLPSPTPLPPLPSVSFSGQPALIVEYGGAITETPRPNSSALESSRFSLTASPPLAQTTSSPISPTPRLPLVSASSQAPLMRPPISVSSPQLKQTTPHPPPKRLPPPVEPKRRSPNKVALPSLPPADFSISDPGLQVLPQTNPAVGNEEGAYVLIGGQFLTRVQAEVALKALQSKGLSAKIVQENKRFRLQSLKQFQGPDAAMQAADQLAQHGLDVVIRKIR